MLRARARGEAAADVGEAPAPEASAPLKLLEAPTSLAQMNHGDDRSAAFNAFNEEKDREAASWMADPNRSIEAAMEERKRRKEAEKAARAATRKVHEKVH